MSIIYVEDFRDPCNTSETDDQVIQKAIYTLEDGDTLIFNKKAVENGVITDKPGTYILNSPVYFTQYRNADGNVISKCRMSLTIDGSGCTISNVSSLSGFSAEKRLFVLSDRTTDVPPNNEIKVGDYRYYSASGLLHCTIRGFNFIGESYSEQDKNMCAMGPIGGVSDSMYIKHCTIENCTFRRFKNGLYVGGGYNTVKNCHFSVCTTGINADCPNYSHFHSNFFQDTRDKAIKITKPYGSTVYNNSFLRCKGSSIYVIGTLNDEPDGKIIDVSVYSNVIIGGDPDGGVACDQNGIHIDGIKSAIVKDNIVRGMLYEEANPVNGHTWGHGIRIDGLYNLNTPDGDNIRFCEKIITSGNQIFDCMHAGIRTNYSQNCVFSNNSIYGRTGDKAVTGDYGILVGKNTSRNVFSNNNLYEYDEDNGIVIDNKALIYNEQINNTLMSSVHSSDLVSPTRYIPDSYVSEDDSGVIIIPDQFGALVENEIFYLYIPEGHHPTGAVGWSYISFIKKSDDETTEERKFGIVYDSDGAPAILESYCGKYIKLKYVIVEGKYNKSYRFTIVG